CQFTESRDDFERSDAVLFRAREIRSTNIPPGNRPLGQKWVIYETEAPTKTWDRVEAKLEIWNEFNLTSTYAYDSDVPAALYQQICTHDATKACTGPTCRDYAKPKKIPGKAAWLVSHCKCPSQRETYVEELRKYFPVDIYGACGTPLCRDMEHNHQEAQCITDFMSKNYKFYFSFENSVCDDYYTEKFTRFLRVDVIQVVLGSVDYHKFLPKGSFLDVRNFASPKDLAETLKYLDRNNTAFNEYIHRKFTSKCVDDLTIKARNYPCRLCQHIHEHRDDIEVAPDFRHFWGLQERCVEPTKFFADIA
uniref:Fucosyltransferase n=1 Tax=Capitella teleta TaxID=283909 RepID=X1YV05_CAPTE